MAGEEKRILEMDRHEHGVVLNALNEYRNDVIAEGRTTDLIDEVLLKAIDALLSSDEVLTIAEEDHKQKEKRFKNLVYALLDLCIAMLLFLPFFAENRSGVIQSVSLIKLDGIQLYLKAAYFAVVIGTLFVGVLTLALQNCQKAFWLKSKTNISLLLGMASVLLFVVSSQPYAAVFAFVLLAIKVFILIKRR